MNSVRIEPSKLRGQIFIPPSKSISHRAVISAGLAEGTSRIENLIFSEDIKVTLEGMKSFGTLAEVMGKEIDRSIHTLKIQGSPIQKSGWDTIDCGESGSTLRFLIPLACRNGETVTFIGKGKLGERPLDAYYDIFAEQGIQYENNGGFLPLKVKGRIKPGTFKLKGNISSQFITGLLFVLPLLNDDSTIIITTELESRGYVDLTLDTLQKFGISVINHDYREFMISGKQHYTSADYRVEGDFSQAAFWLVAGALGADVRCQDLNPKSLQGDRAILEILKEMGADLYQTDDLLQVKPSQTTGIVIDAAQCPDLVPILAVLGALSQGTTKITKAARLRIKESDRLKAISTELNKLGAQIEEKEDELIIQGVESLRGGTVDSWNDHRIAMALAIASIRCSEAVVINGSDAVRKSYPHFWKDFTKLGGKLK